MKYQDIVDSAYKKMQEMASLECFDEVYNIVNSEKSDNTELYQEACEFLGFVVGESGYVIIEDDNAQSLAAFSLVFCSLAEDGQSYPIFFNQERENIEVQYLTDDLFILSGIESIYPVEVELENQFLNTLNQVKGYHLISYSSILTILDCYKKIGDINIAIADYIQLIRRDDELLCNFNISDVAFVGNSSNQVNQVLKEMYQRDRLDSLSHKIIQKALKR